MRPRLAGLVPLGQDRGGRSRGTGGVRAPLRAGGQEGGTEVPQAGGRLQGRRSGQGLGDDRLRRTRCARGGRRQALDQGAGRTHRRPGSGLVGGVRQGGGGVACEPAQGTAGRWSRPRQDDRPRPRGRGGVHPLDRPSSQARGAATRRRLRTRGTRRSKPCGRRASRCPSRRPRAGPTASPPGGSRGTRSTTRGRWRTAAGASAPPATRR